MSNPAVGGMYETEEISLADVVRFLLSWWKLIVSSGIAGVVAAYIHLIGIPNTFEAQTIVTMAKAPVVNAKSTSLVLPYSFEDVESPALLAERMSLPSTFPESTVEACAFGDSEALMGAITIIPSSNQSSTLRFLVRHSSPELAKQCANAVFEMIRKQQAALAEPVIARLEKVLNEIWTPSKKEAVVAAKLAGTSDRDIAAISLTLAVREFSHALSADSGARMLAPVYAPEQPVPAVRKRVLMSWGAAGVFMGLSFALLWALVARFRSVVA